MAAVVVLTAGGLASYLASTHHQQHGAAPKHRHNSPTAKVLKVQAVGIIGFGPADSGGGLPHSRDDRALMLQPTASGVSFVAIPAAMLTAGVPTWTDDQMADGTDIFIYTATGRCLTPARDPAVVRLAHCDLALAQRWRQLDAAIGHGQAFAKYANAKTGRCLTAPPTQPGPATLTACGGPRQKNQEIAFWWNA